MPGTPAEEHFGALLQPTSKTDSAFGERRGADEKHLVSVSYGSAAGHCQAGASLASILMPGTNDGLS